VPLASHKRNATYNGGFFDKAMALCESMPKPVIAAISGTALAGAYQPITEPAVSGDGGLVRWVSGRPGEAPAYAGTDFIIAQDGRIAAVYLFFDKAP
jgi:hypothetical protein